MVARLHATKGSALANTETRGVLWLGRGAVPGELERLAASAEFSLRPRTDATWPAPRVAWLQSLPAIRRDHGSLARRRVAVLHPDPGAADAIAEALRGLGARAIVLGLSELGMARAEALDPEVIIVSPTHLDGCRAMLDTLWSHRQLRWTPMLFVPDERLGPAGLDAPDVRELAITVGMLCAEHIFLGRRAQMESQFAIALHMLGPTRTLTALVETGRPLRACFRGEGCVIEVDVSEGIVVGARGGEKEPEEASLLGVHALAALYELTQGNIVIRHVEHPAVTNVMAPLEAVLLGAHHAPLMSSQAPEPGVHALVASAALEGGIPRVIAEARFDNRPLPPFAAGGATPAALDGQPGAPTVAGRALWAGTVRHRGSLPDSALEQAVATAFGAGTPRAVPFEASATGPVSPDPPAPGVAFAEGIALQTSLRSCEPAPAGSDGPWTDVQMSDAPAGSSLPAAPKVAPDETVPDEFTETWLVRADTKTWLVGADAKMRLSSQARRLWAYLLVPALLCGGLVLWVGRRSATPPPVAVTPPPLRAASIPPTVPSPTLAPAAAPVGEAVPEVEARPVDNPPAVALPEDLAAATPASRSLPLTAPKPAPEGQGTAPMAARPGSQPTVTVRAVGDSLNGAATAAELETLVGAAVVRGHTLRRAGDLRAAREVYLEALNIVPEYPRALAGLAETYLLEKNQVPALATVQRLLARRQRFADDLRLLGDIYMLDGRLVEARDAYTRASRDGSSIARERLKELPVP